MAGGLLLRDAFRVRLGEFLSGAFGDFCVRKPGLKPQSLRFLFMKVVGSEGISDSRQKLFSFRRE